jgi:hypothetical protein
VGTSDQLIALCNIRRKVRQSQKIGWVLWWHGFSVGEQYWKKQLESRAASYDKSLPIVIAAIRDELSDYHSGLFAHLRKVRIRNVLFRQLRKRLGRERFDNFLFLLTEILQGNFDGWPPGIVPNDPDLIRDKMTFDRALGLFRARSEADIKNNPGLHDDVENVLVTLSRRLGGSHCRAYRTNQARKN